ncbi:MAG: siphovirus Gp157 family protein, partial [Schwartzia sp.]|nr:siphovirus Gp157 family protein [Schwartzia sp. (in: firmicutes)]
IPELYLVTVTAHKEVDRDALYAALDKGAEIPGAHLEPRGRGLRIR